MNYNECYQIFIGVTLMWPYKSSHLLVSFNRSSLDNNLPLGSARFALWRLPSRLVMALTKKSLRAPHLKQQVVSRQVGPEMTASI